jgi:hypothetical protein
MEGLINAASSFMQNQGGQQGQGQQQQGGGGGNSGGFDMGSISSLVSAAQGHSQQNGHNEDASMFSQVASRLQTQHQQGNIQPNSNDPNDDELINQHQQVVNGNDNVDTSQIGNAAALGAIKNFLGGNNSNQQQGGGGMQSQMWVFPCHTFGQ